MRLPRIVMLFAALLFSSTTAFAGKYGGSSGSRSVFHRTPAHNSSVSRIYRPAQVERSKPITKTRPTAKLTAPQSEEAGIKYRLVSPDAARGKKPVIGSAVTNASVKKAQAGAQRFNYKRSAPSMTAQSSRASPSGLAGASYQAPIVYDSGPGWFGTMFLISMFSKHDMSSSDRGLVQNHLDEVRQEIREQAVQQSDDSLPVAAPQQSAPAHDVDADTFMKLVVQIEQASAPAAAAGMLP